MISFTERKLHIGTSGYYYKHWVDLFYPKDVRKERWLEFYAGRFGTVEINSTFYHLPREKMVDGWRKRVPDNFLYTFKVNRRITHVKKLNEAREDLYRFLHLIKPLKVAGKLGTLLFQLPPSMKVNAKRLEEFLEILPTGYKCVFEFRNPSWFSEQIYSLLRKYGAGFCIMDLQGFKPVIRATAPFVYFRFHGPNVPYSSPYSDQELKMWAGHIRGFLKEGREVFAYFNNDIGGYAVGNALTLEQLV
ncbi:DUF72 domain-containing protein [candidate division KSB1 bacterium]|nr:DUF72 domain-containing protein [candidate division KSB1 bacterium]